jgi:hypothetical protein
VKFYLKNSEESNEIGENNECELIRKVIVVFILNWGLLEEVKVYRSALQMTNKQDKKFEAHFIKLERFNKSVEELENRMNHWVYFLTTVNKYEIDKLPGLFKRDPYLKPAIEALGKVKLDEKEEIYEKQREALEDM